jgi:hypothetical protein
MLLIYFGLNELLWGLLDKAILTHILFSDGLISEIVQRSIPEQYVTQENTVKRTFPIYGTVRVYDPVHQCTQTLLEFPGGNSGGIKQRFLAKALKGIYLRPCSRPGLKVKC